jgi:putative copper export protein
VTSPGATRIATDLFEAVRAIGYLAIAVIVGGLMFLVFVWPDAAGLARTRVLLGFAWAAGFVTSLLGFGLQSALTHQRGVGGMLDTTDLGHTLATHAGQAWAARGLLFLLVLPLLAVLATAGEAAPRARWWQISAAVVGLALVRAPGLSGHSIEGLHGVAGSAADFVHLAAMSMWVGGLVLMAFVVLPEAYPSELAWIVPRFSKIAAGSVVVLVAAGAVLGWDIAGGLHGLLHTHYGRLLGIKVLLLAAALVAARSSKRWTDSRLRLAVALRGDRVTVRPFAISVAAEAVLAVAVLGVASVLVSSSPGI